MLTFMYFSKSIITACSVGIQLAHTTEQFSKPFYIPINEEFTFHTNICNCVGLLLFLFSC